MADRNADAAGSIQPTARADAAAFARSFPDAVPLLIDAEAGVRLRAASTSDLPAMVEQCRDPEMIRWTTVPTPEGGYQLRDAEEFLASTAAGWTSGERLGWTIEAQRGGQRGFCGSIDLRPEGDGVAEVGLRSASGGPRPLDHESRLAPGLQVRIRGPGVAGHQVASGGRQLAVAAGCG